MNSKSKTGSSSERKRSLFQSGEDKMKKAGKRILGLLMAVLMIFQLPFSVLAEDWENGSEESVVYSYDEETFDETGEIVEDITDEDTDFIEENPDSDEEILNEEQADILMEETESEDEEQVLEEETEEVKIGRAHV